MKSWKWRRGLTVIEVIVVVIAVVLLIGILLPVMTQARRGPHHSSESSYIRGIHQGMVLWAQNNKDVYPLPSLVDVKDDTVAEKGREKDTTANIMSLMIFNGF